MLFFKQSEIEGIFITSDVSWDLIDSKWRLYALRPIDDAWATFKGFKPYTAAL